MWEQLNTQLAAGTTVFFSTHDLQEADERAHQVAIIDHGRVVTSSPAQALKRRFSTQTLRVSFRDAAQAEQAMAVLGQGVREERGSRIAIAVGDPQQAVLLIRRLEALRPEEISLSEPSLADIFERLLDHSLPGFARPSAGRL